MDTRRVFPVDPGLKGWIRIQIIDSGSQDMRERRKGRFLLTNQIVKSELKEELKTKTILESNLEIGKSNPSK
jgi:hypothetical protein